MYNYWREIAIFETSEQRLADQVRAIKTNKGLSYLEIEEIRRNSEANDNVEIQEGNKRVDLSEENSVHRQNIDEGRNIECENTNDIEGRYNEDDVTDLNNIDFEVTAEQMRRKGFREEYIEILERIIKRLKCNDKPPNLRRVDRKKLENNKGS